MTRILNRGNSRIKNEFHCFLEIKGTDADFVTDAAYEFRTWLENADLYGEFFGTRKMITKDNSNGLSQPFEPAYAVAMLLIYVDKRDFPLVKKLYKKWDLELKKAVETCEKQQKSVE